MSCDLMLMNRRYRRMTATAVSGIACVLMVFGCADYRLGTTLPKGIKTVCVPTFINQCGEPLIENDTTSATKSEFQKDGALSIASADEADLILDVTLVKYVLEPLRYDRNSQMTTEEYRLKLTANIVVTQVKSKKVLVKTQVEGQSTFLPGTDLTSAKRDALPKTAEDLAHQIVSTVVEAW